MDFSEEVVKRLIEIKLPIVVFNTDWFQTNFAEGWTLVVVKLPIGRYIGLYPKTMLDLSKSKYANN